MKLACPHQQFLWRVAAHRRHISCRLLSSAITTACSNDGDAAAANASTSLDRDSGKKHFFYEMSFTDLKEQPKVGAFQKLPMVAPSDEIVESAFKRAKRVEATKGISNLMKRERNRGAKQLDFLTKALSAPLRTYTTKFPKGSDLHAYERSLLDLSLGRDKYEEVLGNVRFLHKTIVNQGKNMTGVCAKASSKRAALDIRDESFKKLEQVFASGAGHVDDLKEITKVLRQMPVANPRSPILCLVGAPNVGKSSLVRVLSSGKPEVCDYPFTTRGISMGHMIDGISCYQVTDTPGLLRRADDERNAMEKLTLSALSFLPTAVLYVHDLTGECGTSVENQFHIYKEMRSRFSKKPWMDVVSKADLLKLPAPFEGDDVDELESYRAFGPPGALRVSIQTNEGIDKLSARVWAALGVLASRMKEEGIFMPPQPVAEDAAAE